MFVVKANFEKSETQMTTKEEDPGCGQHSSANLGSRVSRKFGRGKILVQRPNFTKQRTKIQVVFERGGPSQSNR